MIPLSIISRAAGTIPAPMIAEIASVALRTVSNTPSMVRKATGSRLSRTQTFVTIPNVPSLPTKSPVRSYPGVSSHGLPNCTRSPDGSTTSAARMWLTVTPYFSVCGPPEFVATLPPMVHAPCDDGSGA